MKILFCNIAWMKFYKGIHPGKDWPINGGSYVNKYNDAHEKYNFHPCFLDGQEICLGYFSTKSTNGVDDNQLHIEKIEGASNSDDVVEGVCVVWCAKQADYDNRTVVVGWYKNASVYREYQLAEFEDDTGEIESQYFSIKAKVEDCVLLPVGERNRFTKWNVPRKRPKRAAYGFGSANVWFADNPEPIAKDYVNKIATNIKDYNGDNWLRKPVEYMF